jgi:hypothetical protein
VPYSIPLSCLSIVHNTCARFGNQTLILKDPLTHSCTLQPSRVRPHQNGAISWYRVVKAAGKTVSCKTQWPMLNLKSAFSCLNWIQVVTSQNRGPTHAQLMGISSYKWLQIKIWARHAARIVAMRNGYISGLTKLFWFKLPFTLKIFHASPPTTVLEENNN